MKEKLSLIFEAFDGDHITSEEALMLVKDEVAVL